MTMTDRASYVTDEIAMFPDLDGVMYLTGVSTPITRAAKREDLGLLVTPASSVWRQIDHYSLYAADNGCYVESKAGRPFNAERWLRWLEQLPVQRALFAALPDVLEWYDDPETGRPYCIGNVDATLERSAGYVERVKELGFPAALVAQDGLEDLDTVPFAIDALFIGGSDGFKLGPNVRQLVAQARDRGMWVHMGRVNSAKRLRYAGEIGCNSADGTFVGFSPTKNAPRMLGWLDKLAAERQVAQLTL